MQRATKKVEKKRLVRYKEGAEMYSMGMNKFQTLAKDAGAILKIDRMVLVDLDIFDQYLEKAAETSSKGKSIFAYEPNSTVSKAYTEFTKEVLADGRKKERLHSHEAR